MAEFENKVVLITGASGNVGSAVARRFAQGGATLVLVGRDPGELKSLAASLSTPTLVESADVTDEAAVDALIQRVEQRYGRIDAAVHTVGGYIAGKTVYEAGLDQLEKSWQLNVRPVYLVCGRVARHMIERGIKGYIVVVLARSALRGSPRHAAYTASKAAALRIVESLALEARDHGIHVNGVSPSTIDTPENRQDMPKADPEKWVKPEEMADAIAFLCSEGANGVYGANLEVYGRV